MKNGEIWLVGARPVRCDQPRALDLSSRGGKRLETIPDAILDEVLAGLAPIFE